MHILILYAWGEVNAGDRAITPGTLHWLRQCDPNVRLTVVSLFPADHPSFSICGQDVADTFGDVEFFANDLYNVPGANVPLLSTPCKLVAVLLAACFPGLTRGIFRRSKVMAAIRNCDLVLLNGGYLRFWNAAMWEKRHVLKTFLGPLLLAGRLGKPYALQAQSLGPFEFPWRQAWARLLFRRLISGASFISVPDGVSVTRPAAVAGVPAGSRVLDAAFFLEETDEKTARTMLQKHDLQSKDFVAITLRLSRRRGRQDIPRQRRDQYVITLSRFIRKWLEAPRMPLAFVCQVPRDRMDIENIISTLPTELNTRCIRLYEFLSPQALRSLYGHAALLVGMRFPSLVFALSMGTPVVGVHYSDMGPEIEGLLTDIGCDELSLKMEGLKGDKLFQTVLDALSRCDDLEKHVRGEIAQLKQHSIETTCQYLFRGA